jgi:hypothetical protein
MAGLSGNFLNLSLTHPCMFSLLNVYSVNGMTSGKISEAKMVNTRQNYLGLAAFPGL